jgi:hypothetical protein
MQAWSLSQQQQRQRQRQQQTRECVMADRDAWEKAESLSKIFAAIFIPVVLGMAGLLANQALEKSKTRDELLKQAIDVVFLSKSDVMAGADKSFESTSKPLARDL